MACVFRRLGAEAIRLQVQVSCSASRFCDRHSNFGVIFPADFDSEAWNGVDLREQPVKYYRCSERHAGCQDKQKALHTFTCRTGRILGPMAVSLHAWQSEELTQDTQYGFRLVQSTTCLAHELSLSYVFLAFTQTLAHIP